ncbi:MAG: hypothetical protein ACM37W_21415 [Actinomycetota bacterium]
MNHPQNSETSSFLAAFQKGIWLFGLSSWILGLTERGIALLRDGYLSAVEITQLLTAAFLFVSWLFLKPISRR